VEFMDSLNTPDYSFKGTSPTPMVINTDLISTERGILDALLQAKENGTMIGIHAPVLGMGTFITGVLDIVINDYETSVVTKGYDVTGYFLDKSTLKLSEIKSVIPFTSIFVNPFLKYSTQQK
jgi:hypothetical protein